MNIPSDIWPTIPNREQIHYRASDESRPFMMLILFYGKELGNVPSRAQGFTEIFLFEQRIKEKLSKKQ